MKQLLLLEADATFRNAIEEHLRKEGFQIRSFDCGQEACRFLENPTQGIQHKLDVIALDLALSDMDGLEVLRLIRQQDRHRFTPVLLITRNNSDIDRVLAQGLWAEDYASKPLSSRELTARINAILRRCKVIHEADTPKRWTFQDIDVDLETQKAYLKDQELELTRREFELLAYFVQNPKKVLSREKILQDVWQLGYLGESRTIDAHVRRVRNKLGDSGNLIETLVGVGYRLG